MKKVFIILLAAFTAVVCASCGESESAAPKNTGVAVKVTGREAQGDDSVKIKEEPVEIKGKKSTQATDPKDPTEPTKAK